MRNSFLALLLANLAFAVWQRWFDVANDAAYVVPELPTIELASERPDTPATVPTPDDAADDVRAAAAVAPTAPDPADQTDADPTDANGSPADQAQVGDLAPPSRCVSVGPFRELAQAAGAAATLRSGGYEPSQRADEGEIWVGYWVYIAGIPSREEAGAIVDTLRQNGITDSYVIAESGSGSLVSLGVFSEIARAGGRRDEARRLGYDPVITDRTRRGTVYWVDVMLEDQQTLDFDLLQSPGRILRLEQRPCQRGAA